jgi:peptide/nickel transport system ATP-binding protein
MMFQDPFASLNPVHTIRYHLTRALRIHHNAGSTAEDLENALHDLLNRVSMTPPERYLDKFPHELSGGQRQRIAIARALGANPEALLADEPVSMLDVSIRLEILNLIDRLKAEDNLAVLYITHDLATARYFSGHIMVMYRGAVVERGTSDEVILEPAHPYTSLLASAAPDPLGRRELLPLDVVGSAEAAEAARRPTGATLAGCRFAPRCPYAAAICTEDPPAFSVRADGHRARCWLHDPEGRHPGRSSAAVGR